MLWRRKAWCYSHHDTSTNNLPSVLLDASVIDTGRGMEGPAMDRGHTVLRMDSMDRPATTTDRLTSKANWIQCITWKKTYLQR